MKNVYLRRAFLTQLLLAVIFGCVAAAPAAASEPSHSAAQTLWLAADFDGDHKADFVSVNLTAGSEPHVQFCTACPDAFTISSGLATHRLRARDLDGDEDRDLVLETLSSVPLAVWINDGSGHFERGNLDDFRAHLSHDESRSFERGLVVQAFELADGCPRGDAVSRPFALSLAVVVTRFAGCANDTAGTAVTGSAHPRGPPSSL